MNDLNLKQNNYTLTEKITYRHNNEYKHFVNKNEKFVVVKKILSRILQLWNVPTFYAKGKKWFASLYISKFGPFYRTNGTHETSNAEN